MTATIRRKNPNAVKEVYSRLQRGAGREVAVGFPRGAATAYPETGEAVATVAAQHVYGVGVPRRDFMAQAQAGIVEGTRSWMRRAAKAETAQVAEQALEAAGMAGANAIKVAIVDGDYQALSEETIRRREENNRPGAKPLIDTGHMVRSVTHVVRDGRKD